MAAQTVLNFKWGLSSSDPEQQQVLIVGQPAHLLNLTWNDVKCKLQSKVTEEVWKRGVKCASQSPGESVELWPRGAFLASLPIRCSRHAAPARAHALAKIVKNHHRASAEHIVLVCRKCDVYASSMAIARSYPLYNMRYRQPIQSSSPPPPHPTVTVEILLVKEEQQNGSMNEDTLDPYFLDGVLSPADLTTITNAANGVRMAAMITDTPCNLYNVDVFVAEAQKVAKELNIAEPTIIRGEELRERGLGGIYGVGRAASCPPALVVLSWRHEAATETVAWVGKGIVYDTGGLSIKSRASMVGMKGDCGGAAAVLGAFSAFVKSKPCVNLHAVLCLAENAVGPLATRPDDIHVLYSGHTVEINNTDAEGRLVLSDGVVYAQKDLKADVIVDIATLTGAQGIATGKYHAAILSNNSELESRAVIAGQKSADLTHPLPFAPELHFSEFASTVADMKNSVADRNNAQSSCAGLFILSHLGFEFPGKWLHIDMAAPAHCGERATGYGVALLSVLFGNRTNSPLLKALSPY